MDRNFSTIGLNDIVPDNLLSIFDENELEVRKLCFLMLCGGHLIKLGATVTNLMEP